MAKWSVLLLALCAGVAYSSPPSSRIIGGQVTNIESHPSMVQIDFLGTSDNLWSQNCAGIILNMRNVLSVAHCFDGVFYHYTRRRIRAGTTWRETGGRIHHVERVSNHPTFNPVTLDGDLTVVRLTSVISYSVFIQRATIVTQDHSIGNNIQVVLAGWGDTTSQGVPSAQLRDVALFTISNSVCAERYAAINRNITTNMLCAGLLSIGGRDGCLRDAGGPLYVGTTVAGLFSWTHECGSGNFPGVSTSIAPYTDWVRATAV